MHTRAYLCVCVRAPSVSRALASEANRSADLPFLTFAPSKRAPYAFAKKKKQLRRRHTKPLVDHSASRLIRNGSIQVKTDTGVSTTNAKCYGSSLTLPPLNQSSRLDESLLPTARITPFPKLTSNRRPSHARDKRKPNEAGGTSLNAWGECPKCLKTLSLDRTLLCQSGVCEDRFADHGALEGRAVKVAMHPILHVLKNDAIHACMREVGVSEDCARKISAIRSIEDGAVQIESSQIGVFEWRTGQIGASQVRARAEVAARTDACDARI
eukprot:3538185-Pleurochrysis_carterae.AAC.1